MNEQHTITETPRKKSRFRLRLLLLAIIVMLQFNAPPAHAIPVTDFGAIAQAALNVAKSVIMIANQVLQQIQHAMKSVIEHARERIKIEYAKAFEKAHNAEVHETPKNNTILGINKDAMMSDKTHTCANARAGAAQDAARAAQNQLANFMSGLINAKGLGSGAPDNRSAAAFSAEVAIGCASGIYGADRYGGVLIKMGKCKNLSGEDKIAYEDADMKIDSVLNPVHTSASKADPGALQYNLPAKADMKDGRIDFSKTANLTGDELAFVAAYMFCENLIPDLPTPTRGDHLTLDDIINIRKDRKITAKRSGPASRCFSEIFYRTAVPSSVGSAFADLHKAQTASCKFLKAMGYSQHASLDNCEQNGLSSAEYDRIKATKCNNEGYLISKAATVDANTVEGYSADDCGGAQAAFEQKMEAKRTALEQSISNSVWLSGDGAPPSLLSRPVGGTPP